MECGSLVHEPGSVSAIVKIAARILHTIDRPVGDLGCQRQATSIAVAKKYQRVDCLRAALDIKWEGLIVIILWRPVWQKKSFFPVFIPIHENIVELRIAGSVAVILEGV